MIRAISDVRLENVIYEKASRLRIPLEVAFELTYACNERCTHCYIGRKDNNRLSLAEIVDVLGQLRDAGTLYLTLTGGEAMVHPNFRQVARIAREKHFWLRIFSNGTLIDCEMAEFLASLKPVVVEISLYATDEKVHESVTGRQGSFKKTMNALDLLQNRTVRTVIKCPIMRCNIQEYSKLIAFADKRGLEYRFTQRLSPKTSGSPDPVALALSGDELKEFYGVVVRHSGELPSYARRVGVDLDDHMCTAGNIACSISPDGVVYPCILMPIAAGSLRDTSFAKIWATSPILSKLRNTSMGMLTDCSSCELLPWCRRCAAEAVLEGGDILSRSATACMTAAANRSFFEANREHRCE